MKYLFRLVLIVLLIAAIVVAGSWFFLSYRPDLTVSALLSCGDYFRESGRLAMTERLYGWALALDDEDVSIPLQLAQIYIQDENYTKAEYTLVSAITANPQSVPLYITLSNVYVAQDKLLDAEQMLERITNDDVRKQIDALRPDKPVIQPASGSYSEYINVSVSAEDGLCYAAVNTDYPSIQTDSYLAPFPLEAGESRVVAITVSDNGLVSDEAVGVYAVGQVIEPVQIQDSSLDILIHEMLEKKITDELLSDEIWAIEELALPDEIEDLSDLSMFTGLKKLSLHAAGGLDLSVIGDLTELEELDLSGCTIPANVLDKIGTLPNLKVLRLQSCALTTINSLVGLSHAQVLDVSHNNISETTALSALTELKELNISYNPIRSVSYLNNCQKLEILHIENCEVSKLTSLLDNTSLKELYAQDNSISDLSVLRGCTGLSVLMLDNNKVEDISVLTALPSLSVFSASENNITAVPEFEAKDCKLWKFTVDHNEITDLSGLAGIDCLNFIVADYNQIADISMLETCNTLTRLDIWDNPVPKEQVDKLEEVGILVNYNPNFEAETEE